MPFHNQAHVCLVRPETVIVYDGEKYNRWEWQPPATEAGHVTRYEVLRCPFCGCPPHRSVCDDDD